MHPWLESEHFYDLMQRYRHSSATNQAATVEAFEVVKRAIQKYAIDPQLRDSQRTDDPPEAADAVART